MANADHFRDWLRQVDTELAKRSGLSHDDLADQPWRAWYDEGMTPAEAAGECLVNEGFPGLAVEDDFCEAGKRMTDRVIVELQDVTEKPTAAKALEGHGCRIEDRGDTLVVSVPDSRDAEEEVTGALYEAGVSAYVYLAEDL
jgi:hypothetical protein